MKSKEELKKLFENGDKPTQEEFWEWQDSYWHKGEKLPLETAGLYKIKGSVGTKTDLDFMTSMTEGDVYNVIETGDNYVYVLDLNNTGEPGWDKLSGIIDLANYQPLGHYVRIGGENTTGNNILLGWTGSELQATVDATTIGNLWHSGNFNPNSKVNSVENAKAIGFSSSVYPSDDGVQYPYFYFDNGTTTGYIPIATQGYVNTRIADNLANYLTIRSGLDTALIAKTDFPLSITDYAADPALTNFQSYYGTSFHFKGGNTWYNRLDFPVYAEKIFLSQGINTTDMTLRGSIDIIPTGVTNWTSNNLEHVENSSKLYSTDPQYGYSGVAPYFGFLSFNDSSNRWRFEMSPATPKEIEVAYSDNSGALGGISAGSYVTQTSLNTQLGNYATLNFVEDSIDTTLAYTEATYVKKLENVTGLGFVGGTPDAPYVEHLDGTRIRVASENWVANNFATLNNDQTFIGENIFDKSPKVPFAIEPDDAVPYGQAEEIAQVRINYTFVEIIYKNSATDLVFNFGDYPSAKIVTITCKGNDFQNIRIENMPRGVTLKILNGSPSLDPTIYFDGGAIVTSLNSTSWAEFYRDQEGDIFISDINRTHIKPVIT